MPEGAPSLAQRTLAEVERAIAALESQRAMLGDAVVDTALEPLRERRDALRAGEAGERRRLVTVLFADLEGFTELSRHLDAEDTRDVVGRCFAAWRRAVEEHDGVVEKFIGDAVMAVFGLHRTREDDAVRAVRAGRAMVAALAEVADDTERRHGVRLHMRVGVDTGDVVLGTLGERGDGDFVAVGPTVNRASRLQGAAPRDGVLISEETRRLVRGRFGLDPRPGLVLKGLDEPVDAYVALLERPAGFDLEPTAGVGGVETATVGRAPELMALQEHLADVVEESSWRITTVVGDAGVGKSRLLAELDTWALERPEPVWWFTGRASLGQQNRPHTLLRDAVATRFEISPSDDPGTVLERCVKGFARAFGETERTRRDAHVVARWLGFEVGEPPAGSAIPREPQALRDEASELLARYLARLSREAPVLILLEDLHWADDASLHWLEAAHDVLRAAPVLVVATARPALLEQRPHWGEGLEHHRRLPLAPLSRRESRLLLAQLLARVDDVPDEVGDLVVDAAEGNPFYIEELVTWLLDAGVVESDDGRWRVHAERVGELRVPATLKGVLQARLDSLEPAERQVLQRASVVGRVFWDAAVARLGSADDPPVGELLETLRGRELVLQRPASVIAQVREYLFKHALLRDVAYEGMLRSHRRGYHALVAGWLAEVGERTGRIEEYAFLVAEHADLARDPAAARWYLRAGERAASVSAVDESLRLLDRGLALVDAADHALRLDLLAAHEEVADRAGEREVQEHDLARMETLLEHVGPDRRARYDLARARLSFDTSRYAEAVAAARRAVQGAEAAGLVEPAIRGHLLAGKALTWSGETAAARAELAVVAERSRAEAALGSLGAEAVRYLGMIAGNEGDYPASLDLLAQAGDWFASVADAEGQGTVLVQVSATYYNQGRLAEARAALEDARPAFARSRYRYGEAVVLGNLATIAAGQGELGAALAWVGEAIEATRRLRDVEAVATNLGVLAEVEYQLGRLDDAERHGLESAESAESVDRPSLAAFGLCMAALAASARGEQARALAHADAAVAAAERGDEPRAVGYAQQSLGYVRAEAGDPTGAREAFGAAERLLDAMGVEGLALEARVGAALALLRLGDPAGAVAEIEAVLPALENGLGNAQPEPVWLACLQVLHGAGDGRAEPLWRSVRAWLERRAGRVGAEVAEEYRAAPDVVPLLTWPPPPAPAGRPGS